MDGGCGYCLLAGKVDWGLPMFVGKVTVDLEVLANALDDLKVDVVQGGAAGDEVLGGFLISRVHLEPFVTAEVVGDPGLAAFVLAADPVAEELAVVGVALLWMAS